MGMRSRSRSERLQIMLERKEELKGLCAKHGYRIKILDDEFFDAHHRMRCECLDCGFIIPDKTWNSLTSGCGCRNCNAKRRRNQEERKMNEILDLILERKFNISVIGGKYVTNSEKSILLRCNDENCNHEWYSSYTLIKMSKGCPKCSSRRAGERSKRETSEVKSEIFKRGFKMLTPKYTGANQNIGIEDSDGYRYSSKFRNIMKGKISELVSKSNEYSIYNINRYIHLEKLNMKLLTENFDDCETTVYSRYKLKFFCYDCNREFEKSWSKLNNGQRCPHCAKERMGYSKTDVWNMAKDSPRFDSFKIYILKCWSDDSSEVFYKLGRTYTSVTYRYCKGTGVAMPYNYDIVKIIDTDGLTFENHSYIWELEKELLRRHHSSKLHYPPKIEFGGSVKECFSQLLPISQIEEIAEKLLTSYQSDDIISVTDVK